jgi:hypothetical protein
MLQLFYASAERHPFKRPELAELLAKARRNNHALDVTGILLYHAGSFLQVLEGDEAAVGPLYEKISRDARHHRLIVLARSQVTERGFGDWSMGFVDLSAAMAEKLEGFNAFLQEGVVEAEGTPERIRKVLYAFRAGDWRQHVK